MTTLMGLLYYYMGPYRVLALAVYIFGVTQYLVRRPTLKLSQILVMFYIILRVLLGIDQIGFVASVFYLRLFWGFLAIYLLFKVNQIDLRRIFIGLAILTIVEYFAIHLFGGIINYLPNYTQKDVMFEFYSASGWLGGAYSFGGNRTVSGVILLAVFTLFDQQNIKGKWLILAGSLFSLSGVAIGLTMIYFGITRFANLKTSLLSSLMVILALAAFIGLVVLRGDEVFYRISLTYLLDFMVDYKISQIMEGIALLGESKLNLLTGLHIFSSENIEVSGYGISFGDFMALEFFVHYGLIGILMFLLFVLPLINRANAWPLMILVAGTFHYGIIFATPGQIVFGYLLSLGVREKCTLKTS